MLWDEARSPPIEVATIRIPRQTFDSPAQQAYCENLSFTPWHSLPEHRPLGGINRVRKAVYLAVSTLRHRLNQAPRVEPTGMERFPDGTVSAAVRRLEQTRRRQPWPRR